MPTLPLVREDPRREAADAVPLALTCEERRRFRFHKTLPDGRAIAWALERSRPLAIGDVLAAPDGSRFAIVAAPEALHEVAAGDAARLARAAYHLGNRHVAVQIVERALRYPADHVLRRMLEGLGFAVREVTAPFLPEPGAYGGHAHEHEPPADKHANRATRPTPYSYAPRIHDFARRRIEG